MIEYRNLLAMFGQTVPYTVDRENVTMPTEVEANVQVNDIFDIDEKEFTFQASLSLSIAWTDWNMWSSCYGEGQSVEEVIQQNQECNWVWTPEINWLNAREMTVKRVQVFFMAPYKSAFYITEVQGKFSSPMSFKKFPRDVQHLMIEFSVRPSEGSVTDTLYEYFRFNPVTANLNPRWEQETGYDIISGWKPRGVTAAEEKSVRAYEANYLFQEGNSQIYADLQEKVQLLFGDDVSGVRSARYLRTAQPLNTDASFISQPLIPV